MAKKALPKDESADAVTLNLIAEVKRQKLEIAKCDRPSFKTNCDFSYDEKSRNGSTNLQQEANVGNLLKIGAFLTSREHDYLQVAAQLNVAPPPFTWNGFSTADWLNDIQLRIGKVQIQAKHAKLESLETRLAAIISPELKAKLELEAITAELNG